MKDTEIIKAALDAKMCFPLCWDLLEVKHIIFDGIEGEDEDVTRERQMEKLRTFAHLIIERSKSNV